MRPEINQLIRIATGIFALREFIRHATNMKKKRIVGTPIMVFVKHEPEAESQDMRRSMIGARGRATKYPDIAAGLVAGTNLEPRVAANLNALKFRYLKCIGDTLIV